MELDVIVLTNPTIEHNGSLRNAENLLIQGLHACPKTEQNVSDGR